MAPFSVMSDDDHQETLKNEKRDFSSIIDFIGVNESSKIKKRRRGDAEKRRRDRINKCLDQLEDLIPYVKQKKLCSKVDKAEVLELTVKYIRENILCREALLPRSNLSLLPYDYKDWNETRNYTNMGWRESTDPLHSKSELCRCGCGRVGEKTSITSHLHNPDTHSRILLPHRGRASPQISPAYPRSCISPGRLPRASLSPERLSPETMVKERTTPSHDARMQTVSPISHRIDYLLKGYKKREY